MRKFYNLLILLLLGLGSTAQTYRVYTAIKTGVWNDATVWTITVRTDGVPMNKVVIPAAYTVTADNGVNGAAFGNVELEVSGRIQMAANTVINFSNNSNIKLIGSGNINGTSNNQQLVIGGVVKYNGSLDGLKSGANTIADNLSGTSPNGFRLLTLPVTFANFYVSKVNDDILIRWATATENNNNHFEVQRSYDGRDWTTIVVIVAVGNSTQLINYSFTDKNMKISVAYYRIKQVDNDGRFTFTVVRSIKNAEKDSGMEIFAGKNKSVTVLFEEMKSTASVRVFNQNGQAVMQKTYQHSAYITLRLVNATPGIYVVQVIDEYSQSQSKKIILN